MKLDIRSGQKFGNLEIIKEIEPKKQPSGTRPRTFLCKCVCGREIKALLVHIKRNRVSCACSGIIKHGESRTKLYAVWRAMKNRCRERYFQRQNYFDRGIAVCEEWSKSYHVFKDWAIKNGYSTGLEIDRIDNDRGYFPDNCRFVDRITNGNNTTKTKYIDYNGERIALKILLRRMSKIDNYGAILGRIKRGYSHQDAIDTPIRKGNYTRK